MRDEEIRLAVGLLFVVATVLISSVIMYGGDYLIHIAFKCRELP